MDYERFGEVEEWDLWQVHLIDRDEVHIRSEWGPEIREVRTANTIPPDRVWFVGTREPHTAKEVPN